MPNPVVVKKSALAVTRDNHLLCVRSRGGKLCILPGGKREPGETDEECILREIGEELRCGVTDGTLVRVGVFSEHLRATRDHPARRIDVTLFQGELDAEPRPGAELTDLVWLSLDGDMAHLASSIADRMVPALRARLLRTAI